MLEGVSESAVRETDSGGNTYRSEVVCILKVAIAAFAPVVLVDVVLIQVLLGLPSFVAYAALPGEVVLGIHMVQSGPLAAKVGIAVVAFVIWGRMARCAAMILPGSPASRESL